jgi:hypothetical protein
MRHTSLMLFIGVAAAGISVSPASATVRIISDPGGPVIDYPRGRWGRFREYVPMPPVSE